MSFHATDSFLRAKRSWRFAGCAILGAAAATPAAPQSQAITVIAPGHSLNLIADSAAPLEPSQVMLGTNNGAGATGIESITVDPATGIIYVQVATPVGSCPSASTAIYAIDPAAGGLTAVVNGGTGFGICERGSDIDVTYSIPGGPYIVAQNENAGPGGELATVNIASGITGTWASPSVFANNTFGMQFAPGIGSVSAGEVVYVADVGGNLDHAPFGGPTVLFDVPPGGGDDLYIQPDGDIVFIGDLNVGIWRYPGGNPGAAATALPDVATMYANAGLPFIFGTRATVCDETGEGFISYSGGTGGSGIFKLNEALNASTLMLTMNADEGIQDITLGPPTNVLSTQDSLYFTVENTTTGAHQVWELTNVCKLRRPKWTQRPHGPNEGFNVASDLDWQTLGEQEPGDAGPGPNIDVADDFRSNGEVITCVRWWGSYIDKRFEPEPEPQPECYALADGSGCAPVPCPTPGHQCLPRCITYNPANGNATIDDCICREQLNDCQPFINGNTVDCMGNCPPGEICVATVINNPDSTVSGCCDCVPGPAPRSAGEGKGGAGAEAYSLAAFGPDGMGPPDPRAVYFGEAARPSDSGSQRATSDYQIDDGTIEFRAGVSGAGGGGDIIWLNQYTVQPGLETIIAISVAWGDVPSGAFCTVLLYDDPNNDGDPSDASLLVNVGTNVSNPDSGIAKKVPIPATVVGAPGDSFFVGCYMTHQAGQTPAAMDTDTSAMRSWVAGDDPGNANIFMLSNNQLPVELVDNIPGLMAGNWLLRANAAGSPVGTGACCLPNGTCVDSNAANCQAMGGQYQGDGSLCSPQLCLPQGACCDPNGLCFITDAATCANFAGVYLGDGTACLGDNNGNNIDDACEQQGGTDIDGWLISFHTDLPADQNPDGYSKPLDLLGLYFCREDSVFTLPTDIFGWDGHRVYEYFVELEECHLIHAYDDPRPGANPPDPARHDGFHEASGFIYWLDIQAVVGHTYEVQFGCPNCTCDVNRDGICNIADLALLNSCAGAVPVGPCATSDLNCDGVIDNTDVNIWQCLFGGNPPDVCGCDPNQMFWVEVPTKNRAFDHFWGWHTSPEIWNDDSTQTPVLMGPAMEWLYPSWVVVDGAKHMIPNVNQAFELLVPCPVDCPQDCAPPGGDGVVSIADVTSVLSGFGSTGHPCDIVPQPCGDGIISIADVTAVISAFGLQCP